MEDGIMKKSLYIATSLWALVACSRETDIEVPAIDVTLNARTETSADSRTVVEGQTHVYWEPGDEIAVFTEWKTAKFTTDITASSSTAVFNGKLEMTDVSEIWAVYPYSENASLIGETITTVLPSTQVARAGSFGKDMNLAVAHSTTTDLQFYNVGGGIRFSLSQDGITEVVLQGLNDEFLAGKVQVGFTDGIPDIREVTEGKISITLTPPEGETFERDTWYYIVAIPGALDNGFKLRFRKADSQGRRIFEKAVTVKRGIFGTLTHADEGVTFKPLTDDIITFKDDLVKSILVQHFDSNEDDEISIDEAAAVHSFIMEGPGTRSDELGYGIFTETEISSFDELVYFSGLGRIEEYAFTNCEQLASIVIPENVMTIGDYALYDCTNLESIKLTSSAPPTLGDYSLEYTGDCPILVPAESLDTYVSAWSEYAYRIVSMIPNNMIWYTSTDGQIVTPCTYDPTGAGRTPSPREVFGANIVSNTYVNGKGVIVFNRDLTSVGDYAFALCSNLESIELPNNVTSIGNEAFGRCSNMTSISLPSGLNSIGRAALGSCSSLESLFIPGGVTSIEQEAFSGCTGLSSIGVSAANRIYDSRDDCNAIIETSTNTLIFGRAMTVIPEGVTKIGDYAFKGCSGLTELWTPMSVKSLGKGAFEECTDLTDVYMDGVIRIGFGAFQECSNLVNVYASEDLTDIGKMAFANCTSLTNFDLPGTIEIVGDGAFAYCSSLTSVTLWKDCKSIGEYAFYGCSGLNYILVVPLTPPTGGNSMFDGSSCVIYVPALSWSVYQVADIWSNYEPRIRPIGVARYTAEAVDLGLSVKWASCNLGATRPEEFGGYYAWGETEPKFKYDWSTYKWYDPYGWTPDYPNKFLSKYCTTERYDLWAGVGVPDGKTVLDPEDDAAYVHLGGKWRMPTREECDELIGNCTWTLTNLSGVEGYLVTGTNGNSIFLPTAGIFFGTHIIFPEGSPSSYWTSSLAVLQSLNIPDMAFYISPMNYGYIDYRCNGKPIRPVYAE